MNSLTSRTRQEQSQCDCVRFNYSEVAYPGRVLLEMSCAIRTAEDGVITLGPCLEKADEIEDRHGHSLGSEVARGTHKETNSRERVEWIRGCWDTGRRESHLDDKFGRSVATKTSSRKEVTGKSCFRKPPWLQENEL